MAIVFVASTTRANAASKRLWNACATGIPTKAIRACTTIINQPGRETTRSLSKAYTGRGYARWRKRQYKQALSDYTMAITLNPRNNTAYLNRGLIYRQQGQYAKAMADYKVVIKQGRRLVSAYYQLARVLENKGDKVNAAKAYRYAIKSPTARSADSKVKALARDRLAGLSIQPVQSVQVAQTCTKYQIVGNFSFCIPKNWRAKILRSKGSAVSQYRFEFAELATIFVDWQYPEGDPRADLGTTNYTTTTLGGQSAIRYESNMSGANGILNQLIVVLDKKDAKGRQLTILFETYGRREAVFRPIFETILKSFIVHSRSQQTRLDQGAPAQATVVSSPQSTDLIRRFGNDCQAVDLRTWQHKTRQVLASRKQAHLKWVWLCRKKTYPVFGVDFHYDPRGQTKDFFYPLYQDLLKANDRWAYSIVDRPDKVIINITRSGKNGFSIDMEELPDPGSSVMASSQPSSASPTHMPGISSPRGQKAMQATKLLFNGSMGPSWKELSFAGGNFKKFARIENQTLVIDVPTGNKTGDTGIRAAKALFKLPEKHEKLSVKLTFSLDADRSSDFVLALIPSNWDGIREWRSHHIRLRVLRAPDGKTSSIGLWLRGKEVMGIVLEQRLIENIAIIVQPDRLVLVTDGADKILLQGYLPKYISIHKDGYLISALTIAREKNMAAKLALRSIALEHPAFEAANSQNYTAAWLDKTQKVVLFDGRILDKRWKKYRLHRGSSFSKHARLSDGALLVDAPKGVGWGKAGIMSPKPLVWLDKFGQGSKVRVSFKFDPDQTTGFVVALTPISNSNGNAPNKPNFYLYWRTVENGGAKAELFRDGKLLKAFELEAKAPETVVFALSPKGVQIEAPGIPPEIFPWGSLKPSQSFHIYAFSHPDKYKQPVKMALKQILLERWAGNPIPQPKPATGVEPLPVTVLFDGSLGDLWEGAAINGADFSKHGRIDNGRMIADVPAKLSRGEAGLLSKKPVLKLDERIQSTSQKLTIKVDPKQTTGFQIMFHPGKRANMWGQSATGLVRFIRTSSGRYQLTARGGAFNPYYTWSRWVDGDWVKRNWDGTLVIEIGDGWMTAHLPGGPSVRAIGVKTYKNAKRYMTIYSHPGKQAGASKLVLEKITSQWVMPDGMNKMDRWFYIEKNDFDPETFMKDLADDLPFPNADLNWSEKK